jgi:hypothetical protein
MPPKRKWCPTSKVKVIVILPSQKREYNVLNFYDKLGGIMGKISQACSVQYYNTVFDVSQAFRFSSTVIPWIPIWYPQDSITTQRYMLLPIRATFPRSCTKH